jgi:hypothetical protein
LPHVKRGLISDTPSELTGITVAEGCVVPYLEDTIPVLELELSVVPTVQNIVWLTEMGVWGIGESVFVIRLETPFVVQLPLSDAVG